MSICLSLIHSHTHTPSSPYMYLFPHVHPPPLHSPTFMYTLSSLCTCYPPNVLTYTPSPSLIHINLCTPLPPAHTLSHPHMCTPFFKLKPLFTSYNAPLTHAPFVSPSSPVFTRSLTPHTPSESRTLLRSYQFTR